MGVTLRILQIPLVNQFDEPKYSHEDFKQFGIELRGALNANQPLSGLTPAQVAAYSAALDAYLADTGSSKSTIAFQKSSTASENEAWEIVSVDIRSKEALVRSRFPKGSPNYIQFFPQGLSVFYNTKKGDRVDLLDNLILRFTAFAADFPGAAAQVTTLKSDYLASLATQADAKGSVRGGRGQRSLSREALAALMHEAWLIIATTNRGNPDVIGTFFNVSIFDKGTNPDKDGLGLLRGLVMDPTFSPLIDASFKVHDLDGRLMTSGRTDGEGKFSVTLPVGFYRVAVAQVGYRETFRQIQIFDNNDPLHEFFMELE